MVHHSKLFEYNKKKTRNKYNNTYWFYNLSGILNEYNQLPNIHFLREFCILSIGVLLQKKKFSILELHKINIYFIRDG